MTEIDINFDFRNDSICGDPDTDSIKLYEAHKHLWTKKLPNNELYSFDILVLGRQFKRILLKNNLSTNLSSDRMCPHYVGKYKGRFDDWLTELERKEFKQITRTIGGHILFPAHRKNGFTINQARGINKKIADRFDLTLECIRRFYIGEESPLYSVILRYNDYFKLFTDFKNYIDFFLLQDFVDHNYQIIFCIPFDNFMRPALPQNEREYKNYKDSTIKLITKRNNRIKKYYQE